MLERKIEESFPIKVHQDILTEWINNGIPWFFPFYVTNSRAITWNIQAVEAKRILLNLAGNQETVSWIDREAKKE